MEELGIDPNLAKTLDEAKALIKRAEELKNSAEANKNPLMERVLFLAAKVGVSVKEGMQLPEIMIEIQSRIFDLFIYAQENSDMDLLYFVKECQFQYDLINTIINGYDCTNSKIYKFIEDFIEQKENADNSDNK